MKRKQLQGLLLVAMLVAAGCIASPNQSDSPGEDDSGEDDTGALPGCDGMDAAWQAVVARVEQDMAVEGVPGLALAVVCDGRTAYAQAWGTAGGDDAASLTPATRFQFASSTKMFTAAAAMRVAEDGQVDLHAPVDTYVSNAATRGPAGEPITLHQLLSHTAGYPTVFPGATGSLVELAGYFASNSEQPMWSPPGEVFNYSNLGMSLAGLVLEQAAGEPFADLVESRIFGPAEMSGASLHAAEVEAEGNFAFGHSGSPQQNLRVAPTDSYLATGYYGPMGGAWGSVLDLAAWAEVHLSAGGAVLEPASMTALATPATQTRVVPEQHYGYGLYIDRLYGFDLLSHGGSVAGYFTYWLLVPEAGFGVFAVVNCDWYYPSGAAYEALDLFVGRDTPNMSPYFSSEDDWPAYEGSYLDPHVLGAVEVRRDGEALIAEFEEQGVSSELLGTYGDAYRFTHPSTGRQVTGVFWRTDPAGDAEYLVSRSGVATRQD